MRADLDGVVLSSAAAGGWRLPRHRREGGRLSTGERTLAAGVLTYLGTIQLLAHYLHSLAAFESGAAIGRPAAIGGFYRLWHGSEGFPLAPQTMVMGANALLVVYLWLHLRDGRGRRRGAGVRLVAFVGLVALAVAQQVELVHLSRLAPPQLIPLNLARHPAPPAGGS
jgi:hypothetical protein